MNVLRRYTKWLHTGWPAGTVEKLPLVNEDGSTEVPGLYVVGDLTGIPLLKFSAHTGAQAVQTIAADPALAALRGEGGDDVVDLAIVGGGVSGLAAALEAKARGLTYVLLEAAQPLATIVNFPKGKPIYTYPTDMTPAGELRFTAQVKEPLIEELREQTQGIQPRIARVERVAREGKLLRAVVADGEDVVARRVIVGIGRSGNYRTLGVPGEERDKVSNRLHDPQELGGQDVLVVGGGDSALEAAIALTQGGARVTLSYRKREFSRPKPENLEMIQRLAADPSAEVEVLEPSSARVTTSTGRFVKGAVAQAGSLTLCMGSQVEEIGEETIRLKLADGTSQELPNQAVFSMIGREAPLDFFRRSGVSIRGEVRGLGWAALAAVLLLFTGLYLWKKEVLFPGNDVFPKALPEWVASLSAGWKERVADRTSVLGTVVWSMRSPSFYYTLLYCVVMTVFGVRRIRRRKTPYVTAQTLTLLSFQLLPLFLLPEVLLPWLGYNGAFAEGAALQGVADALFPLYGASDAVWPDWGHPRAYWKAYGLILAWPLNVWNVFTDQPQWGWLLVSFVQTFVIIPLLVWRWGKGAYCGWICSCGGMAETLGDTQRHKMPHGPLWNRLNMVGQVILLVAFVMLGLRIAGWCLGPKSMPSEVFAFLFKGAGPLSWQWSVDIVLAGILGFGLYFHFSGRTWCRFACPLAALMHIYARFSQFRILAEKKKCISCNVCTSVCHQGIDVMSFANKGLPMEDPECVRCSACVQSCPTGVLRFGRVDRAGRVLGYDPLAASPVDITEGGRKLPVVQ